MFEIKYQQNYCELPIEKIKETKEVYINPELEKIVLGLFTKHCYKKYKGEQNA
jgi:hypothetical protein